MKTKIRNVVSIWVMGLIFLACNKGYDDLSIQYVDEADVPIEVAVELGSISINAFIKDVIEVTTGKPFELEALLDEMFVIIKDDSDNFNIITVLNSNYRDITEPILLEPGYYSLLISNYAFSAQRFDDAVHGAQVGFIVTAGSNSLLDLELALLDIASTINFSSEILTAYPEMTVRVEYIQDGYGIGPNLTWTTADNKRTGYFNAYAGDFCCEPFNATTGTLNLEVTAIGINGLPVTISRIFFNARANQHYNISIEQNEPASASLTVTLGDEDIIEETIIF